MKKLYLISYYFAPLGRADGVNRTYLVKYLAEAGWDIEVISCANPHGFIRSFQKDPSLLDVIPPNVKLHPIKSTYWGPIGGIAELMGIIDDSFSNWIRPVIYAANTIIQQPGFIYAIVPPVTNAKIAAHIVRQKNLPLVIDFRDDVFNLDPTIVREAKTIIASTQASLDNMLEHYQVHAIKGAVIYNGYGLDRLPAEVLSKVVDWRMNQGGVSSQVTKPASDQKPQGEYAMCNHTTLINEVRSEIHLSLDVLVQRGAQRMLEAALETV